MVRTLPEQRQQAGRLRLERFAVARPQAAEGPQVEPRRPAAVQLRQPRPGDQAVDQEGGEHVRVLGDDGGLVLRRQDPRSVGGAVGQQQAVPTGEEPGRGGRVRVRSRCARQVDQGPARFVAELDQLLVACRSPPTASGRRFSLARRRRPDPRRSPGRRRRGSGGSAVPRRDRGRPHPRAAARATPRRAGTGPGRRSPRDRGRG